MNLDLDTRVVYAVGLVIYNPEESVFKRICLMTNLGYKVYVFDNSPNKDKNTHAIKNDPKIFYLLAQARKGRGDKNGARAAVDQALQQRPDQPEFLELQRQLSAP